MVMMMMMRGGGNVSLYWTQVSLGSDLWVRFSVTNSQTETPFAALTEVADEDTNLILTDNANRTIQGNVATHVTLPSGQLWNQCK